MENKQCWSDKPNDYILESVIGKGGTSTVHKARIKDTGKLCAIKIFDLDILPENIEERILKEITSMQMLIHKNIIDLYGSILNDNKLWVIIQYFECGSVRSILNKQFPGGFPEPIVGYILGEVLCGLKYLHLQHYLHRDIKAANILVNSVGKIVLCDLGITATLMGHGKLLSSRKTFAGSVCWMAPEVMDQTNGHIQSADIWSFGVTVIELVKGKPPYFDMTPHKVVVAVITSGMQLLDTKEDKKRFSIQIRKIVAACVQKSPKRRPTADILSQPKFFKKTSKGKKILLSIL